MVIENSPLLNNRIELNRVEEPKDQKPPMGILAGKKVYYTRDPKAVWISRIMSALIIAGGIALIAGLTTAAAITGGVVLIVVALLPMVYPPFLTGLVKAIEDIFKEELVKKLNCKNDFSDLPALKHCSITEKHVTIKITKEQIEAQHKAFIFNWNNIQNIVLLAHENNQATLSISIFDPKLKNKTFSFEVEGQEFVLTDLPKLVRGSRQVG